ncbi:MAG: glutamine amidotransferase [Thermoguttaceae bacterium]
MQLFFYPIADSYLLVAALGLALAALLAMRLGPALPLRHRRVILTALRAGVIVLLLLAMLRPTLVYTQTKKEKATLVLLADATRSMSVRDGLGGKSRWELLRRALVEAAPALRSLAQDFEVKGYTFDAESHPAEVSGGRLALPDAPEGRETAIGAALEDVLRQEGGKRLLGIVLLTDGRQQAVAPRDLPPQTVAARLRHQGDLVFPVVFGQSHGLGAAQDVAVKDLLVNERVFVKNELSVTGRIRVDGYVNREIPIRLLMETAPGKMAVVAQQQITASADGQLVPVHFTYTPETPGEFKLTLEAVPQPGELVTTNNQLSTFVQVLKGGLRVLDLEGALRVEQKFIRRALDASRDIKVDSLRLDPRQTQTRPARLAELFQPGKYEVYILGDIDSGAFLESELKSLAEAVSRGAGLIMLGGFHSFGPGGYYNTPLADVLPVVMDRLERQRLDDDVIRADVHLPGPLRMRPTPLGLRHFALALAADPAESAATWNKLPPLDGANKFLKLAPRAVTLADADADESKPLLVTHDYGNGRVMAFAGDSTWHWWMHGFESAHKRFWRQVVLWLARKDQLAEGNVWVKLEARRFAPGDRVEFTAGAQSPHHEPITDAEFRLEVVLPPNGTRTPGLLVRQDDQMLGSFRDTQVPGDYAIEVTAVRKGQLLGTARARFFVTPQDLELDNAAADPDAMESLAKATGGKSVAPEQLSDLLQQLTRQSQSLEIKQETKTTLWDRWPLLLALVGLLSLEWYFRKRWGLV